MASLDDLNATLADAVRAVNGLQATIQSVFPLVTLSGSATFDPPSIAGAGQTSTTVTVTGAVLGQYAVASFSLDLQLIQLSAYVSAANTVTCLFKNGTAGAIDLASGTLAVRVFS